MIFKPVKTKTSPFSNLALICGILRRLSLRPLDLLQQERRFWRTCDVTDEAFLGNPATWEVNDSFESCMNVFWFHLCFHAFRECFSCVAVNFCATFSGFFTKKGASSVVYDVYCRQKDKLKISNCISMSYRHSGISFIRSTVSVLSQQKNWYLILRAWWNNGVTDTIRTSISINSL